MRRYDRAVKGREDMLAILRGQNVLRLALHDTPYPYIVPMHYGIAEESGRLMLYLHGAREGRRTALMRRNPHVAFEVDEVYRIEGDGALACTYTTRYASIIGEGVLRAVTGEEKQAGLLALMHGIAPGMDLAWDAAAVDAVAVLCLEVTGMTGKRNAP